MANAVGVGQTAPDFALPSAGGETIRLADYRGKSEVVLFFYPSNASGGDLSEAVRAAREDMAGTEGRAGAGLLFARDHLGPKRFGQEWSELLCSLRPEAPGLVESVAGSAGASATQLTADPSLPQPVVPCGSCGGKQGPLRVERR